MRQKIPRQERGGAQDFDADKHAVLEIEDDVSGDSVGQLAGHAVSASWNFNVRQTEVGSVGVRVVAQAHRPIVPERRSESRDRHIPPLLSSGKIDSVKALPAALVDRLPVDWWCPGNLHLLLGQRLHFCTDSDVRTVEWNDRVIGRGRRPFSFDRWE